MFYDTFAAVCKKKKVSPCATALAIGISKSNVTEWKKGRSPKLDTVLKLAKQLGVSPMQLIPKEPKEDEK